MKVTLTKNQALIILQALEGAENDDFPEYDSYNAKLIRLQDKFRALLDLPSRQEEYLQTLMEMKKEDVNIIVEDTKKKGIKL